MSGDILLLVIGALVGGFVQGLSGFAFSMVAMSFWAWGLDPKLASVMAVFGSLTGQLVSAFTVRRALCWSSLLPYLAGGTVGIPIGVLILPVLNPNVFKLGLGIVLIVWCPLMLLSGRLPHIRWGGRPADLLAGFCGGVMGGLGGLTGVIPTLWSTLRGLDKEHQRAIIQNFNLATLAMTMTAYVATGVVTSEMLPLMPVVAIALLFPAVIGARVYSGLRPETFRRIVLSLLSLSGLAMLVASMRALFG